MQFKTFTKFCNAAFTHVGLTTRYRTEESYKSIFLLQDSIVDMTKTSNLEGKWVCPL